MLRFQLTFTNGLIIACMAIAAHVLVVVFSRKISPLGVIGAVYLAVAPFSVATELWFVPVLKVVRMYSVGLLFVLSIMFFRLARLRSTTMFLLAYLLFSLLAAVWSENAAQAALFKIQPLVTIMCGVFLAYSADTPDRVRHLLRIFSISAMVFALLIWVQLIWTPSAMGYMGRLRAFGINANRIGQSAAPFLVLTAYVALYDRVKAWKVLGYIASALLAVVVVSSGSRGAVGESLIGLVALGMPLVRQPIVLAVVCTLGTVTAVGVQDYVVGRAAERIADTDMTQSNREIPWTKAIGHFRESPIYGKGWVFETRKRQEGSRSNMHSMYLQALAETGLIGFVLLVFACLFTGIRYLRVYFRNQRFTGGDSIVYFGAAISAAVMAHGVIEFGTITGTTVNAICFGFGVGLLDQLRRWGAERARQVQTHVPAPPGMGTMPAA